jgi:hypothetical protein
VKAASGVKAVSALIEGIVETAAASREEAADTRLSSRERSASSA